MTGLVAVREAVPSGYRTTVMGSGSGIGKQSASDEQLNEWNTVSDRRRGRPSESQCKKGYSICDIQNRCCKSGQCDYNPNPERPKCKVLQDSKGLMKFTDEDEKCPRYIQCKTENGAPAFLSN